MEPIDNGLNSAPSNKAETESEPDLGPTAPENNSPGTPASPPLTTLESDQDDAAVEDLDMDTEWRALLLSGQLPRTTHLSMLITEHFHQDDILAAVGEPFGPLALAMPSNPEGPGWIAGYLNAVFGGRIEMNLTAHDCPNDSPLAQRPHEVVFMLMDMSNKAAEALVHGHLMVDGVIPRGILCLYPEDMQSWMEGQLTIRCSALQGHPEPSRDDLYDAVRGVVLKGLRHASQNSDDDGNEWWFTQQGWRKKPTDHDWLYGGADPFTAWCIWKQCERRKGAHFTEHSTHSLWQLGEGRDLTSSHVGCRIKKEYSKKPMEGLMNIRFPIALGDIFSESINKGLPALLDSNILTYEPLFASLVNRALKGEMSSKDHMRTFVMRTVAIAGAPNSEIFLHPSSIIDYLVWQGYNVGGVNTEIMEFCPPGGSSVRVAVSKVVLGKHPGTSGSSFVSLVTSHGGASGSHWPDTKAYKPKMGYDIWASEGVTTTSRPQVKSSLTGVMGLSSAIELLTQEAVAEGMATGQEEILLRESVALLRKKTL